MQAPNQDFEHLRLLSIFHYVYSGLTALVGLFSFIYIAMGAAFMTSPELFKDPNTGEAPPEFVGGFMIVFGVCMMVFVWGAALCDFLAARFLSQRRHRVFCMVVGCINCLSIPLGTILGVFTLIVLNRPSVKASFDAPLYAAQPPPFNSPHEGGYR